MGEAEEMRESDQKKKETVTAKNDAETLGYQVEKQLTDLKEKISKENASELKTKLEALRSYMTQDDAELDDLKEKTKDLQELSWKVTQEVYQQAEHYHPFQWRLERRAGGEDGSGGRRNEGIRPEKEGDCDSKERCRDTGLSGREAVDRPQREDQQGKCK